MNRIAKIIIVLLIFSATSLTNSDKSIKCYNEYCTTPIGLTILPIFPYAATCGNGYVLHESKCPLYGKYCCPAIQNNDGVILCKEKHHKGNCKSYFMHGKSCVNVDVDDDNSIKSVNTIGNCVRLYDETNCLGKSVTLYPGSLHHSNLLQLRFNDKTSSFGKCYDNDICGSQANGNECDDVLTIGALSTHLKDRNNLPSPVTLFQIGPFDRTEVLEALITPSNLNTGTVATQNARNFGRRMGNVNDEAAHILSIRLGGSGSDLRNIFPMSRLFDYSKWSKVDDLITDVVNRYGGAHFTVNLLYKDTADTRPYKIVYRIKSINSDDVIILNDLLNP